VSATGWLLLIPAVWLAASVIVAYAFVVLHRTKSAYDPAHEPGHDLARTGQRDLELDHAWSIQPSRARGPDRTSRT
jgi:hypothetical protein